MISRNALPDGVYALTDRRQAGGRLHEEITSALLEGGVRLIQIREKEIRDTADFAAEVGRCLAQTRRAGACLVLNDDPSLAVMADADGVHVGQEDCSPREARRILGAHRILGLSTHTREQFLAALEEPVDYVAIGPVFGTLSKASPYSALGLDFARWAAGEARRKGMTLAAIGGINLENLGALLEAAPGVRPAVIGAIMTPGDIAEAARRFLRAECEARRSSAPDLGKP